MNSGGFGASSSVPFGATSSSPAFWASLGHGGPAHGASFTPSFGAPSPFTPASFTFGASSPSNPASGASASPASGAMVQAPSPSPYATPMSGGQFGGASTSNIFGTPVNTPANAPVFGTFHAPQPFVAPQPFSPPLPLNAPQTFPAASSLGSPAPSFTPHLSALPFRTPPSSSRTGLLGSPSSSSTGSTPGQGSRIVPFQKTVVRDGLAATGTALYGNYMSISAMPQCTNKSVEELRVEDYQANAKSGPWVGPIVHPFGNPTTSSSSGPPSSPCGTPPPTFGTGLFGSPGPPLSTNGSVPGQGSRIAPFQKTVGRDGPTATGTTSYESCMSITAMPQYINKSVEELRFEDYQANARSGPWVGPIVHTFGNPTTSASSGPPTPPFGTPPSSSRTGLLGSPTPSSNATGSAPGQGSRIVPFRKRVDQDGNFSRTTTIGNYMSISGMSQYINKSVEELRCEDYQANTKCGPWVGPIVQPFGHPAASSSSGAAGVSSAPAGPSNQSPGGEEAQCVICLSAPRECGFLHGSSMHLCVCRHCKEMTPPGHNCPICRQTIERVIDVYQV